MGIACGKAAVDQPPAGTISQYHSARPPQPTANHIHYAAPFTPSASPPAAASTPSGITIYPMIDETSSPIVSRRVDMSGFKVKTSFDAGSAQMDAEAAHTSSTVDAAMLRQQMQVLSRLKSHSTSGRQSVGDGGGAGAAVSRTESPSVSSEVRVAQMA